MKYAFASLAAALAFVSSVLAQDPFSIITPVNPVVCQPLLLSWTGGTAPYFLPGNQPGAAALVDLGQQQGNSFTWTVNIAAGTSVGLSVRDSTGNIANSAPFNINAGTNSSCVGQSSSAGGSATSSATSGAAGGSSVSSTRPASSTAGGAQSSATSPATSPTSSGSRSSPNPAGSATGSGAGASQTPNAAISNLAPLGFAGAVAAIFAIAA